MQAEDVRVTIRVERELKENAEALFGHLGLNMSNAINVFLRKAVEQRGIPFQVSTSARGIKGLDDGGISKAFAAAVSQGMSAKRESGLPVAGYDAKTERAYLENPDGSREYV